jgi:methyl-accepting chemotaxis protein
MNARKKLLINPKFQLSLIAYMNFVAISTIAIFYGAVSYFFWRLRGMGVAAGLPPTHVFFEFLHDQRVIMNGVFLVTALLAFVVLFASGLVLSHRIAGPIERLKSHLDRLTGGETEAELTFRERDYFDDLPEPVNRLIRAYVALKKR